AGASCRRGLGRAGLRQVELDLYPGTRRRGGADSVGFQRCARGDLGHRLFALSHTLGKAMTELIPHERNIYLHDVALSEALDNWHAALREQGLWGTLGTETIPLD